jgi:hypothetical protein
MARHYNDQGTIRQYLLGQLTDDSQQKIEERLLTEADFFEELEVQEDELIDEYLAGKLTIEEQGWFEKHFLATTERDQKLRFARALNRYVTASAHQDISRTVPFSSSFWNNQNWALRAIAAVVVIGIIAGVLWIYRNRTLSSPTFSTIMLTIGSNNRGEGVRPIVVKLPLPADALRIVLRLPEGATLTGRYHVRLISEGETKNLEVTSQDAQSISVVMPAANLQRGQYALQLFTNKADGTEQRVGGSYFFTVE